jgi:hypothetical protein
MRYLFNILLSGIAVVLIVVSIVPILICIAIWGKGYTFDPLNGDVGNNGE